MKIQETTIEGIFLIQPKIFSDERGIFFESYNQKALSSLLGNIAFVQDNQSFSKKGVLRGLHFQNPPYAQDKLVCVLKGAVLDVVVDLRKNSPTYGKHFNAVLSEQNKTMLWIPKGFAHGFVALEDNTHFYYKCSEFYNREAEDAILWNDSNLGINWGIDHPIISEKDKVAKPFKSYKSLF